MIDTNNSTITCHSTHLTSFAVLVDVSGGHQVHNYIYRTAGYFRRVFIFGYFKKAFLCENKFLGPTALRKYIPTINNQIVYTHVIPSLQCECDC